MLRTLLFFLFCSQPLWCVATHHRPKGSPAVTVAQTGALEPDNTPLRAS